MSMLILLKHTLINSKIRETDNFAEPDHRQLLTGRWVWDECSRKVRRGEEDRE